MPVIIIGGIWSGLFTPSESASIAVMYGLAVSLFYYKDMSWRRVPQLLLNAFVTSATVMLVIGATGAMAWLITVEQVAVQIADWIQIVATEQWMFLLLFNVSLLLLGIFIEPLPAMLLCAPLFLPLAKHFNMDMVHIGVVMTANLAIALYTPPVGGTLFVAARLAKAGIGEITRAPVAADGRDLHGGAADHLHPVAVDLVPALAAVAVGLDFESPKENALLALVVEFRIKPEHIDAFARAIDDNARASRDTEPGCRQFDVCRDPDEPALFFLYELYDDNAAIDAHLKSAHFQAMNAATAGWVASKSIKTYTRVAP